MGLMPGCDIYLGRTKNVAEFRVTIEQLHPNPMKREDSGARTVVKEIRDSTHWMCPAALKRANEFFDRGTQPPSQAKAE